MAYKVGQIVRGTKKPPGPARYWRPVKHKGVFYGYKYVGPAATEVASGGSSGGGGGGGYYRGGGGAKKGLSAYIQAYRLMFDNAKANPPKDLLKKAEAGNWSTAYWNMMVRLQDKKYPKSAEAKRRMADLVQYWKAVLPGTKVNRKFANQYLRHGWTQTQLQNQIMKLPQAKKQYKYWAQFKQAQRVAGQAKIINPLQYKAYQKTFRDVYKQAGLEVPQGYEKLFFKSGLSDQEFVQNYQTLAQTRGAAAWDIGAVTQPQEKAVLFGGKGSAQLRTLLEQAANKQQRYMQAAPTPYRVAEEENVPILRGI